jgi:predicted GNAT superfamily acetyltransferase
LQREVFGLPELEISPRRHLIVSRQAGGWTLGAFVDATLVGFVHHLVAVRGRNEVFGYSHMMAVAPEYQNKGVGARLKWSQRARAIGEGRNFITWTWDPLQARNAHFNLNRLGVTVSSYAENFYGTDYATSLTTPAAELPGIDSDRLFATWDLQSRRVVSMAKGGPATVEAEPQARVKIPANWTRLVKENPSAAKQEQLRVRHEFKDSFAAGLICAGFERSSDEPEYLLYRPEFLSN